MCFNDECFDQPHEILNPFAARNYYPVKLHEPENNYIHMRKMSDDNPAFLECAHTQVAPTKIYIPKISYFEERC